jgi:hypothetical protein
MMARVGVLWPFSKTKEKKGFMATKRGKFRAI